MLTGYVFEYHMSAELYEWLECLAQNGEDDIEDLITEALWEYLSERVPLNNKDNTDKKDVE